MAFLATSGQNEYLTMSPYIGNKAGFQEWRYVTQDALSSVLAADYITDTQIIRKFRVGDVIRCYKCTDRNDISTQDQIFVVKVTAKTTSTITLEAEGYFPAVPKYLSTLDYFGGDADGVFQNDDVINTMIAAVNDGDRKAIELPPGVVLVSDAYAPTNLIGTQSSGEDYFSIRGHGPATVIEVEAGSGTSATVFQIGQGGNLGIGVSIRDLAIRYMNTPTHLEPTFDAFAYYQMTIENIIVENHAKLIKATVGGPVTLRNWKCVPGDNIGATDSVFHFQDIAVTLIDDIWCSDSSVVANTDADGKMVHVELVNSASIDTLKLNNFRCTLVNGTADGRPYGFYLDAPDLATDGSVVNQWITDCVFDGTAIAGMYFNIASGNDSIPHAWWIRGNHMITSAGRGIVLSAAGDKGIGGTVWTENWAYIRDNSEAFDMNFGSGQGGNVFTDNMAIDGSAAGIVGSTKAAFKYTGNGWLADNNSVGSFQNGVQAGWNHVVEISGASSTKFHCGIHHAPGIKRYSKEPVYTGASMERMVERPIDQLMASGRWFSKTEEFVLPGSVGSAGAGSNNFEWQYARGSDDACAFAHTTDGANGLVTLTTGNDAGGTMALNGIQLQYGALNVVSQQGGLYFRCRLQINAVTNVALFMGMTDQIAALEMPFTMSVATLTSNATNAAGILFDSAATNLNYQTVGVKADVDATVGDSAVLADTGNHTFEMLVDENETAYFWIDGAPVGSAMASCFTESTKLAPVIAAFSRSSASRIVTLDRIQFGAARVVSW